MIGESPIQRLVRLEAERKAWKSVRKLAGSTRNIALAQYADRSFIRTGKEMLAVAEKIRKGAEDYRAKNPVAAFAAGEA